LATENAPYFREKRRYSASERLGDLPSIAEKTLITHPGVFVAPLEVQPTALFVAEHQHEQKNKVKTILEIGKEYRKVLVVAHYVAQVEELAKELSKDRETFMVHGSVKDQEEILKKANEVDECYLVIQASLGAGFDADSFSCVVFASMSYRVRDFVQMKYRVRRIHNLHPVEYNYLIGGRCDKAVKKVIDMGRDFVPSEWDAS
jgi:superfamily II DNA or RNA helicase